MSLPDYAARNQTHTDTILSFEDAVLTITLNRPKQSVPLTLLAMERGATHTNIPAEETQ